MSRILKGLLQVLLVVGLVAVFLVPCAALTPVHNVSEPYRNSPYYKNLQELELTGDPRTDLILVALSQLGYHEGDSDDEMHGQNREGSRNFAEYNRLHGKVDNGEGNGTSYGYHWCCSFATWCARQAGLPKDVAPSEISCWRLIDRHFKPMGVYHPVSEGYKPIAGDYIFFRGEEALAGAPADHVGIVLYVDGSTVYTIEGNSRYQCVAIRSYSLKDAYIVGYASPTYADKPDVAMDFNPKTAGYRLYTANYYVTAESTLRVRAGASSLHKTLGYLKNGDTVVLREVDGAWGRIQYQGQDGWVSLAYLQYVPTRVTATVPTYTVTYKLGESVLERVSIEKGGSLVLPALPQRESSDPARFYFEAVGWDSDGDLVADLTPGTRYTPKSSVTLEAVYSRATTLYTIRFIGSGSTVLHEQKCAYGETPTPPDLSGHTLANGGVFDGWDRMIMTVTEDADYVALYTAPPMYVIRFLHEDGEVVSEQRLPFGAMPIIPDEQLMLLDDGSIFLGWDREIAAVSGDMDYHPLYEQRLDDATDDPPSQEPNHEPNDQTDEDGITPTVLILVCGGTVLLLAAVTIKISAHIKEQYTEED